MRKTLISACLLVAAAIAVFATIQSNGENSRNLLFAAEPGKDGPRTDPESPPEDPPAPANKDAPAEKADVDKILQALLRYQEGAEGADSVRAEYIRLVESNPDAFIEFLKTKDGSPHEDQAGLVIVSGKPSPALSIKVMRRFANLSIRVQAARILIPLREVAASKGFAELLDVAELPAPLWKEIWAALAGLDAELAMNAAMETLRRDDKTTQKIAAQSVAQIANGDGADWLLSFWRGRVAGLEFSAMQAHDFLLEAFVTIKPEVLTPSVERFLAAETDGAVRNRLIFFLKGADPKQALAILLGILKNASSPEAARRQAIYALAQVASKEAALTLLEFLSESTEEILRMDVVCALLKVSRDQIDADKIWAWMKDHEGSALEQLAAGILLGAVPPPGLTAEQTAYLRDLAWQNADGKDENLKTFGVNLLIRTSAHYAEGQEDLLKAYDRSPEGGAARALLIRGIGAGPRSEAGIRTMQDILSKSQEPQARGTALSYLAKNGTAEEIKQNSTQILKMLSEPAEWLQATLAMAKDGSDASLAEIERLSQDESVPLDIRKKIGPILQSIKKSRQPK